ncbi:MAG: hypothetical protein ACKOA9_04825 [Actinomycetota bacterium]
MSDALPEDLDVTAYVGPYQFPGTHRRRIAGTIYLILAAGCAVAAGVTANVGLAAAAVLLGVVGAYHHLAAWRLRVDQTEALTAASRAVGFPVGHASGQLGFRGMRSRPSWRILLFSADDPPSMRGLVELDGVDGTVLGEYTELNPEDWSEYGLPAGAPPA